MAELPDRVERVQKPRKCPQCKHAPVATILYGMPAYDDELTQAMEEGRISLGGCLIGFDDPVWECTKCGLEIYRKGA